MMNPINLSGLFPDGMKQQQSADAASLLASERMAIEGLFGLPYGAALRVVMDYIASNPQATEDATRTCGHWIAAHADQICRDNETAASMSATGPIMKELGQ